jgi:hypothetical protein
MTLSADQGVKQLWSRKPYGTESGIPHEAMNSSEDDKISDAKRPDLPPGDTNPLEISFKLNSDNPESTDGFFLDKIERVTQAITETIFEMKNRQRLNESFIQGIDSKMANLLHELDELKHWSLGNNASIETRRIHLEKEVLQLEKEKRINNLNCWRDILLLKKDLREALGEYKTLTRFKKILS